MIVKKLQFSNVFHGAIVKTCWLGFEYFPQSEDEFNLIQGDKEYQYLIK